MSKLPRVVSAAPRIKARERARRRDRTTSLVRRGSWTLALLAPLVLLGWVVVASPLLAVQKVVVVGERRLSVAAITAVAGVPSGTPLARVDTGAVAARIRALAPVASVTVSRGWPHELRVKIVERVPVVAVTRGSSVVLLDYSAAEVATVPVAPHGVFPLSAGSDAATRAALSVLHELPRGIAGRLRSLAAPSPEQVTLILRDGRQILWGGPVDSGSKAAAVLALMRMPGRVFDVSSPGVVTRR